MAEREGLLSASCASPSGPPSLLLRRSAPLPAALVEPCGFSCLIIYLFLLRIKWRRGWPLSRILDRWFPTRSTSSIPGVVRSATYRDVLVSREAGCRERPALVHLDNAPGVALPPTSLSSPVRQDYSAHPAPRPFGAAVATLRRSDSLPANLVSPKGSHACSLNSRQKLFRTKVI